jgi:predicted permease
MALGAGGNRILRQLLTEGVLLSLAGGGLGVLLACASIRWIRVLGARSVPRLADIGIDARVLAFTLLISLFAAVLFGLVPALRLIRLDVYGSLKVAGRDSSGAGAVWGRGNNLRKLLVVGELALSVVLLVGAGLLIRSFARIQNVHPGFDPRNILTAELTMNSRKYEKKESIVEAYRRICERLESLPGATAAGAAYSLPLSQMFAWGPITVEGRIPPPGENFINADQRVISGHFFQALSIPLVRGRFFTEDDTPANPRVAIIDTFMAEQLWPGQEAVGKRIRFGGLSSITPWVTVVGIVGRIKEDSLETDPRIALYLPHTQYPTRAMNIVLKTAGDPVALAGAVKQEIRALDPDLPLYNVRTMQQRVDAYLAPRRFSMLLLGIFAALAMALAAIGIYGVMAYLVSQGTREIGIRMALGATPHGILGFVLRRGMALALIGVGLGTAGALVLTRLMRSLLFAVSATDPLTFALIPLLLTLVALAACAIPARRAVRVDPAVSLRAE